MSAEKPGDPVRDKLYSFAEQIGLTVLKYKRPHGIIEVEIPCGKRVHIALDGNVFISTDKVPGTVATDLGDGIWLYIIEVRKS